MSNHPIQPLAADDHNVIRFKQNTIVRRLVDEYGLNEIAVWEPQPSSEDWQQLAQLIGYSLDGYCSLSYVNDEAWAAAQGVSLGVDQRDARIEYFRETIVKIKKALQDGLAAVYEQHPSDF